MSGPLRVSWTFPKSPDTLINALQDRERHLVELISEKLSDEQQWDREVKEYREKLREVGVTGWESAIPEGLKDRYGNFRRQENNYIRELDEVRMYLTAIIDDKKRDPHRLYKLSPADLKWFELD